MAPRGLRARIDRALLGELGESDRVRLFSTLRGDAELRGYYDRATLALRMLEGEPPVAQFELDLVESWLVATPGPADAAKAAVVQHLRGWLSWRTWLSVAAAGAAALLVALLVRVPAQHDEYVGVRGSGPHTLLTLHVYCDAGGRGLVSAQDQGCDHTDTLAFSYRIPRRGVLTLFGVDAGGDPMFYAPTPDDQNPIVVKPGDTQAVGAGVHLQVNHAPGTTRVFGIVSPVPPTLEQVRAMADALSAVAPAADGDDEWIERIDPDLTRSLCPRDDDCHAAEVVFEIRPTLASPAPAKESAP